MTNSSCFKHDCEVSIGSSLIFSSCYLCIQGVRVNVIENPVFKTSLKGTGKSEVYFKTNKNSMDFLCLFVDPAWASTFYFWQESLAVLGSVRRDANSHKLTNCEISFSSLLSSYATSSLFTVIMFAISLHRIQVWVIECACKKQPPKIKVYFSSMILYFVVTHGPCMKTQVAQG